MYYEREYVECPYCHGTGIVKDPEFHDDIPCPECEGAGELDRESPEYYEWLVSDIEEYFLEEV